MKNGAPDVGSYESLIAGYERDKENLERVKQTVVKLTEIVFKTVEKDVKKKLEPKYRLERWSVGNSVMGTMAFREINFECVSVRSKDGAYMPMENEGSMDDETASDILKRIEEQVAFLKKYNIGISFPYYLFGK